MEQKEVDLNEVFPKSGLVYSEKNALSEILCKPKLLPIKSTTLKKLKNVQGKQSTNNTNELN